MVTARTTAPPVRRTTRGATKVVAPTVPGSGEDGLADQLNRVLRITQPQEKVPKLRNPPLAKASSIKATVTAGPSKTPARPSKTDKPVATKKVVARAAPPTSLKGKEKQVVLAEEEPLPWETSASGTPLRPTERAKLASAAINTSLKSLSAAVQSGYRYGALPPARKPVEGAMEEIWTDVRIMALVETGEAGLKALRGIEKEGGIGDRAVQIEQAGQTLVVRCLALGMHRRVMTQLSSARPYILRLYTPISKSTIHSTQQLSPVRQSKLGAAPVKGKTPIRSTLPPTTTASSSKQPVRPRAASTSIPLEWHSLVWFPAAADGTVMTEAVQALVFQALICARIGLAALGADAGLSLPTLLPTHPSPHTVSSDGLIHPLHLALSLPMTTTTPLLHMMYRHLTTTSSALATSRWLQIRQLALIALCLTISTTTKNPPTQLWDTAHRFLSAHLNNAGNEESRFQAVSDAIGQLIEWAEVVMEIRAEEKTMWFEGKSWIGLLDMWISLGRKLDNTAIIDRALALMTGSTSLKTPEHPKCRETTPAPPSKNATSAPTPSSRRSTKGKRKAVDAQLHAARICGDLAKSNLVLDQFLSSQDSSSDAAAESAIRSADLGELVDVLLCLPDEDEFPAVLSKALRAMERIQRPCIKILDRTKDATGEESNLTSAARQWLIAHVEMVEDILRESDMDLSKVSYDLIAPGLTSLLGLARNPHPLPDNSLQPHPALVHLNRARKLCQNSQHITADLDQADWLRSLASAARVVGTKLYQDKQIKASIPVWRAVCDWSVEAVLLVTQMEQPIQADEAWVLFGKSVPARWETLAVCMQKVGDMKGAVQALGLAFTHLPKKTIDDLAKTAAAAQISSVLEKFEDLNTYLIRVASTVLNDPAGLQGSMSSFTEAIPIPIRGVIAEQLLRKMEEGEHIRKAVCAMIDIVDAALVSYDATMYPVRRLRLIVRMMGLINSSGLSLERFDDLANEAEDLGKVTVLNADQALAIHQPEYQATACLIQTLHAYYSEVQSSQAVSSMAKKTLGMVRRMILPALLSPARDVGEAENKVKKPLGRTTTTKAPSRVPIKNPRAVSEPKGSTRTAGAVKSSVPDLGAKAKRRSSIGALRKYDDIRRLSGLLGALASLLGMLGHVLTKVEAIKVLRALLRGRAELVEDYVTWSAELATEYMQLGKHTRANFVFLQTFRVVVDTEREVSPSARVELHLRYSCFLAESGNLVKSREEYSISEGLAGEIIPGPGTTVSLRIRDRVSQLGRASLARKALAAMCAADDNAGEAISHLIVSMCLWVRAAEAVCRLAPSPTQPGSPVSKASTVSYDPFSAPTRKSDGLDEPAEGDQQKATVEQSPFAGRHLNSLQWCVAEGLLGAHLELATAFAQRGSVSECSHYLEKARIVAETVRSDVFASKIATRQAQLQYRLQHYEKSRAKLGEASDLIGEAEALGVIDIRQVEGDLYARMEMIEEAGQAFAVAGKDIEGLDKVFTEAEAMMPSPKKVGLQRVSASTSTLLLKSLAGNKEPLLPAALAHVVRRQAWMLRETGDIEQSEQLLAQIRTLTFRSDEKADEFFLDGRIGLHDALAQFKTDLFMSSLTESTIAMPMVNTPNCRERQSTRATIYAVLQRSEEAFKSALSLASGRGRVEDIRQACMSLALLRAFQTSLGQGSPNLTSSVANLLASTASITLHRELLEAVDCKYPVVLKDEMVWPSLPGNKTPTKTRVAPNSPSRVKRQTTPSDDASISSDEEPLRSYWESVKAKHSMSGFLANDGCNLDSLAANWAVVSINVTEDRNTMFISRHQKNCEPIVFCMPLDRQGRREGEEDMLTFDAAVEELKGIIEASDTTSRLAKNILDREGKLAWWVERKRLDEQLRELLSNIEYVWLGAFKTILSPRTALTMDALDAFRLKIEKIFAEALGGSGNDVKKGSQSPLGDALLKNFATLSSKSREEEIEDLVWFILDLYQFHGVPVAPAELDIDQIGVDVKEALIDLENASRSCSPDASDEHLFLVLDKNAQDFPWESIPILRKRSVSRVPSLPYLIDQISPGRHLQPTAADGDFRFMVNARKVFYILNPSGDLTRTQTHFEPWISQMVAKAGWRGIVGRSPTELEMIHALSEYDLVLYFGHGGAEHYIRSHKIRNLTKCATTMLWGCSSGMLKDQGDLDRTGTAWHYMIAGCPSLVANLWDVTDRDIDLLAEETFKKLNLDAGHLPEKTSWSQSLLPLSPLSTVQAVAASRDICKLKYLTGAAAVVYGLPVYLG